MILEKERVFVLEDDRDYYQERSYSNFEFAAPPLDQFRYCKSKESEPWKEDTRW